MIIKNKNFISFWQRSIIRKVKDEFWIIDPHNSYASGKRNIISVKFTQYKKYKNLKEIKELFNVKILNKIEKEYENLYENPERSKISNFRFNYKDHYPWKVGIELTAKCNFKCIHCYAEPLKNISNPSYEEIKHIIDKLFDSGVIWLWFTGGECTLRKDFLEIYKYAKQKGFIVTILTNGSLISDEMINCFEKFPPMVVKLSQYGISKETYKVLTGSENNFYLFRDGINKLIKNKINISVQNIITIHNEYEKDKMIEFCEKINVQHNVNLSMIPKLNGNITPLKMEPKEPEIVHERKGQLIEFFKYNLRNTKNIRKETIDNNEFFCGAGLNFCFITADLKCVPCFIARNYGIDLKNNNKEFTDIFLSLFFARKKYLSIQKQCKKCKALIICNFCKLKKDLFSKNSMDYNNKCKEMMEIYNSI